MTEDASNQCVSEKHCSRSGPQHDWDPLAELVELERAHRSVIGEFSFQSVRAHCNQIWREKVCQWCYDVVDHLSASREVVYLAMDILDRFCVLESSLEFSQDERAYELAAMTGLYLALRLSGRKSINASQISRMSRRGIKAIDIAKTGKKIIQKLSWDSQVPTPSKFVRAFIEMLPASINGSLTRSVVDSASYIAEISVCDSFFSGLPASEVAYGAVMNALHEIADLNFRDADLREFCNTVCSIAGIEIHSKKIERLRCRLIHICRQSEDSKRAAPDIIPESELREATVVLSKQVSMRVVSSDSLGASALLSSQSVPRSTRIIDDGLRSSPESNMVSKSDNGLKRPVSPSPGPQETRGKRRKTFVSP